MIGEVDYDRLITPQGSKPGDRILLTKGVPIEATAIIGREFSDRISHFLNETESVQSGGSPGSVSTENLFNDFLNNA